MAAQYHQWPPGIVLAHRWDFGELPNEIFPMVSPIFFQLNKHDSDRFDENFPGICEFRGMDHDDDWQTWIL